MIFVNPWASYDPDDIPNLTPQSDDEMVGCLAGICGYIVASAIYASLMHLCFTYTEGTLRMILVAGSSIVIYPILLICLMKLSFKIRDKICKMKSRKSEPK